MFKYKFIACAYDLKIEKKLNKGIKVLENLRVSNNPEKLNQMFSPLFANAVGILEYNHLLSHPYFYAEGTIEQDNIFYDNKLGIEFLNDFLKKIQMICGFLWLVKDNSVHAEFGYIQLEKKGEANKIHSNANNVIFNNVKGERKKLTFSEKELKLPEKFYKEYFNETLSVSSITHAFKDIPVYEGSRLERAFYLLQAARAQSYLPERISIFISLLETLFSTSNTDVTHKLKERIAWLLGQSYIEREEIFNDMGVIYDIRSHNVHNSTVPTKAKTKEKLILYTDKLEKYVREAIKKILSDDEIYILYQKNEKQKYDDKNLELFFKELCLGKVIPMK